MKDDILEKYLEAPHICPFCGRGNMIDASEDDINLYGKTVSIKMFCTNCNNRWRNEYSLVGIISTQNKKKETLSELRKNCEEELTKLKRN